MTTPVRSGPGAPRSARRRRLLATAAALACSSLTRAGGAAQAMVTEVLTVGYSDAVALLPSLQHLVPAPGSISAFRNQLVVRTTEENLAELRRVLEALDRAPVNLVISVRQSLNRAVRADLLAAQARFDTGDVRGSVGDRAGPGGARAGGGGGAVSGSVQVKRTRRDAGEKQTQRVRVLEGREAFISSGQSIPVPERQVVLDGHGARTYDSVHYRELGSGVWVRPRLHGEQVTLEVAPRRESLAGRGAGVIDSRGAATVVSGPLGRWMMIGGIDESINRSSSGIAARTSSRQSSDFTVYVKVERLD